MRATCPPVSEVIPGKMRWQVLLDQAFPALHFQSRHPILTPETNSRTPYFFHVSAETKMLPPSTRTASPDCHDRFRPAGSYLDFRYGEMQKTFI